MRLSSPPTGFGCTSWNNLRKALVGGWDADGAPLYVCLANYGGGQIPGKTRSNWNYCDVGYGGAEHAVSTYLLVGLNFQGAGTGTPYVAGTDSTGAQLGICVMASYSNSFQPGKYLISSGGCNIGYGGAEISQAGGFTVLTF